MKTKHTHAFTRFGMSKEASQPSWEPERQNISGQRSGDPGDPPRGGAKPTPFSVSAPAEQRTERSTRCVIFFHVLEVQQNLGKGASSRVVCAQARGEGHFRGVLGGIDVTLGATGDLSGRGEP